MSIHLSAPLHGLRPRFDYKTGLKYFVLHIVNIITNLFFNSLLVKPFVNATMAAPALLVSTAAALATTAYLNAKFGVGIDLQQLSYDREWQVRLKQRLRELGDTCTLYRMFELADSKAEALWFEGQTWTYEELKKGENPQAESSWAKSTDGIIQRSINLLLC